MNKKNYVWLVVGLVVVVLAAYLIISWPEGAETPDDMSNVPAAGIIVDEGENAETSDGTSLPVGISPTVDPSTDSNFSQEVVVSVDGDSFSPKTIEAKAGTKAFLTFSAQDEERHTFAFTDPSLDFLVVVFDKAEGDKSITFPAPAAGSYTFYVDSKDNTGTLLVK